MSNITRPTDSDQAQPKPLYGTRSEREKFDRALALARSETVQFVARHSEPVPERFELCDLLKIFELC